MKNHHNHKEATNTRSKTEAVTELEREALVDITVHNAHTISNTVCGELS